MKIEFVHVGLIYLYYVRVVYIFHNVMFQFNKMDITLNGFSKDALNGKFLLGIGVVEGCSNTAKLAFAYDLPHFVDFLDIFLRKSFF